MGAVVEKLRQRAEEAARQADRARKLVEVVEGLNDDELAEFAELLAAETGTKTTNGNGNGHRAEPDDPDAPRGREAVRRIVAERPGIWTLAELRDEMQRRGWFTSASGLEAAAKRLCDVNREGRRIGKGRYVFPRDHGEEDAIESDASGGAMIPSFRLE
jgi:hypothetical protein